MFELKLHGVRGSIPCVGPDFVKYGGDTTCIEIETDKLKLIFDAGTGFRNVKLKEKQNQQIQKVMSGGVDLVIHIFKLLKRV